MTIKEIAELCGVDRRTVERWAHKLNPGHFAQGIQDKLKQAEKSGVKPADFSLEETLAIIGEGSGNTTLASLLAENAANKNALTVYNNQAIKPDILREFERIIDQKLQGIIEKVENSRLDRIEELLNTLVSRQPQIEYRTVEAGLDEAIHEFYRNHVITTDNPLSREKLVDVWDLFKYVTKVKYPKRDFFERFLAIYPQHRKDKLKGIAIITGLRLKDKRGVC